MAAAGRSTRQLVEIVLHGKDVTGPAFIQAEKNAGKLEKQINKIGNASMVAGSAVLGGLLAAVKQAGDLEGYIADALTLTNVQGAEYRKMKESMTRDAIDLSRELGVSGEQIAQGFYQVISSGAKPTEAAFKSLSRTGIELAKLTGLDVAYAVESLSGTVGAFGYQLERASRVADVFFVASKNTLTTVPQLAEAFKTAAPQATALGMSIETTATLLDALAAKGIKGSEAGTALRMILGRLSAGNEEVQAGIKSLGTEVFTTDGKMRDMLTVLREMQIGYSKLTEQQKANVLKTIAGEEALSKLATLMTSNIDTLEEWRKALSEEGALERAYSDRLNTLTGQLDLLKAEMKAVVFEVGNALLPAVTELMRSIRDGAGGIARWIAENQTLVKSIAGISLALIGAGGLANALIKIHSLITRINTISGLTFGTTGAIAVGVLAVTGIIVALLAKIDEAERKLTERKAIEWQVNFDTAEQVRVLESLLARYKRMLEVFGDETKITVDIEPLGLNAVPLKRAVTEVAYALQQIRSQPIDVEIKVERQREIAELESLLAEMRDKLKRFGDDTQITVDVKALGLKDVSIPAAIEKINERIALLKDTSREAGQSMRQLAKDVAAGKTSTDGAANSAGNAGEQMTAAARAASEWSAMLARLSGEVLPRSTEGTAGFGTEIDNMLSLMDAKARAANIEFLKVLENAARAAREKELQDWLNKPVEDPVALSFNDEARQRAERQVDRLEGHVSAAFHSMMQEGNVMENVLKSIWRSIADEVVAQISRMIARWVVFRIITAGLAALGGTISSATTTGTTFETVPIPENLAQHGGTISRGVRGLDTVALRASRGETVLTPELTDALKQRFLDERVGGAVYGDAGALNVTINAGVVTASEQELVRYSRKTRRALLGYEARFIAKGLRK